MATSKRWLLWWFSVGVFNGVALGLNDGHWLSIVGLAVAGVAFTISLLSLETR